MKALLIDNDLPVLEILSYNLLKRGHMVYTALDGLDGLDVARGTMPDIIVLDYSLPVITGAEVCGMIRLDSDVPIVFLSALAEDADRANGMSAGADEYIVKPYNMRELLDRLEVLACTQAPIVRTEPGISGISIDIENRELRVRGRKVAISPRQLRLFYFLAVRQGRTFSKRELMREVWRKDSECEPNFETVDTQIRKLREIVERNPSSPKLILSVKKLGYKFKKVGDK